MRASAERWLYATLRFGLWNFEGKKVLVTNYLNKGKSNPNATEQDHIRLQPVNDSLRAWLKRGANKVKQWWQLQVTKSEIQGLGLHHSTLGRSICWESQIANKPQKNNWICLLCFCLLFSAALDNIQATWQLYIYMYVCK